MGVLYLVAPVYAQTISISNLQYPSTVLLGKQVVVSFTVNFSGLTPGVDYLIAGVENPDATSWAAGSVLNSNPDNCQADSSYTWEAVCYYQPSESQGSENLAFSLTSTSVGTLSSYGAKAVVAYYSPSECSTYGFCVATYRYSNSFSISVVDEFTLTVNVPSQVSITLDGTPGITPGSIAPQLSPGMHEISVPDIVQLDSTSRLLFNGWSDGSTQLTRTFDLESDTEISATYVTQYLVNATSDSTLQSGWYDQGTVLQLNVSNQLVNNYRLFTGGFDGWYNGGQLLTKSPSAALTIDGPVNLSARWNYMPYLPPLLIIAIVAVVLFFARRGSISTPRLPDLKMLKPKRSRRRIRRSKPKVETVTPDTEKQVAQTPEIKEAKPPEPVKTIMYCTQCGAVISRDSKFCKECGTKQG